MNQARGHYRTFEVLLPRTDGTDMELMKDLLSNAVGQGSTAMVAKLVSHVKNHPSHNAALFQEICQDCIYSACVSEKGRNRPDILQVLMPCSAPYDKVHYYNLLGVGNAHQRSIALQDHAHPLSWLLLRRPETRTDTREKIATATRLLDAWPDMSPRHHHELVRKTLEWSHPITEGPCHYLHVFEQSTADFLRLEEAVYEMLVLLLSRLPVDCAADFLCQKGTCNLLDTCSDRMLQLLTSRGAQYPPVCATGTQGTSIPS
jgi:hypothetical protein